MSHIAWQILADVATARQQELRAKAKAHATWWEARRFRRGAVPAVARGNARHENAAGGNHTEKVGDSESVGWPAPELIM